MRRPKQTAQSTGRGAITPLLHNKVTPTSIENRKVEDFIALLAEAKPMPDQMQVSLFTRLHPGEVKEVFSAALEEEPQITRDGKYWHYPLSKIWLSCENTYFHHVIRFSNPRLLPVVSKIVSTFSPKPNGRPAAQLFELEIAFDVPLPKLSESDRLQLLDAVAKVIVLKNPSADIRAIGKENMHKKTADGSLNGPRTWYFELYHHVSRNENRPAIHPWQPVPTAKLVGKLYLKKELCESHWKLRMEVTLRGSSLKSRLGSLAVPEDFEELMSRMRELTTSDFWKFEIFDGEQFKQTAKAVAKKHKAEMSVGKYIYVHSLISFLDMSKHQSATRQRGIARKTAKALQSKPLLQKIYKGVFSKRIL